MLIPKESGISATGRIRVVTLLLSVLILNLEQGHTVILLVIQQIVREIKRPIIQPHIILIMLQ